MEPLFQFQSRFLCPQKSVFAPSLRETDTARRTKLADPPLTLLLTDLDPTMSMTLLVNICEEYIGRVNYVHTSLDTHGVSEHGCNMLVQFAYWYHNPFTQRLKSELIIANEHNRYVASNVYASAIDLEWSMAPDDPEMKHVMHAFIGNYAHYDLDILDGHEYENMMRLQSAFEWGHVSVELREKMTATADDFSA